MFAFNPKYGLWALLLFLVEVFIAIFIKDSFVRPFVGDVLAVILVYCFVRAFWRIPAKPAAFGVFLFACCIEGLQYLDLIGKLGWKDNKLLVVILGSSFDWKDILAYGIGCAIILIIQSKIVATSFSKKQQRR